MANSFPCFPFKEEVLWENELPTWVKVRYASGNKST